MMKGALYAVVTSILLGSVAPETTNERHYAHEAFHALLRGEQAVAGDNATCGCVTTYSTYYGEATCMWNSSLAVGGLGTQFHYVKF